MLKDMVKYKGHWVCCLGCQQSMATHTIIYNLEHNITNTFICSSVGGEYAAMSMLSLERKTLSSMLDMVFATRAIIGHGNQ